MKADLGPVTVTPDLGVEPTCYLCGKAVDLGTTVYPDGSSEGERWVMRTTHGSQLFHRACWEAFVELGEAHAA